MLSKLASFLKANPAAASWLLNMAVLYGAKFGLHVTTDQLVTIVAILGTWTHAGLHVHAKRQQDKITKLQPET